jgi:two-component system, OmpR family, phosphate regulon sensor histidine kinase PhoR
LPLVPGSSSRRLGYKRIVQLLVYLVIIPTVLLLLVGIILLFLGTVFNVLFGVLTVAFVLVAVTGIVLVLVFLRREANLSELQADFVSKVSHELRTPLTSIRLFVETMERARTDPATMDQCVTALGRETERLTHRIERLLDWGRMEAGRKQYELRPEPVAAVVDDAVKALEPIRNRHSDVQFTAEIEPGLSTVEVDRAAMLDALINLLSNAVKYGGTPPVVTLRVRAVAPGNVAFEVTDNGEGIPRVEHRRIFEKFYRIDDRLSREREGSGLGLAIVKHVVRAHRGRIQLDSAKGKGSTFRLLIPVTQVRATQGTQSAGESVPPAPEAKRA